MDRISTVRAREVLDSRGNPTIEVEVVTSGGFDGRAIVPSGASTGEHEALELRDGDRSRYLGRGVLRAVGNVHSDIAPKLQGLEVERQKFIDDVLLELDGTPNKSRLGANALLGVSMAVAQAAAASRRIPLHDYLSDGQGRLLPMPFMNVVNGGAHADNPLDFQEFMIVPGGFPSFRESLRAGVETFHSLKAILRSRGCSTNVGDEGGFAPNLSSIDEVLRTLVEAIEKAGYRPGRQIALALDVASSELRDGGNYVFKKSDRKPRTSDDMIRLYERLAAEYPIVSIEDGMAENDWEGWVRLTERIGDRVQLVGDDLFVTHTALLRRGIHEKAANSILIKLNQVGTVSETVQAVHVAREAGYSSIISHRSGESEDAAIADLAVALHTGMIKTGSASRADRTAKYNQLLRIEERLGARAEYRGFASLSRSTT